MKVAAVFCLLAAAAVQVYALPSGAPRGACADISPGHTPPANSVSDPTGGPFQLDISNFTMCTGAGSAPGYCYYPGQTYYLALSGMNSEQFRGLLVQGRQVADGSPVGTFINFGPNTQASQCTPPTSAVTHTNNNVKTSELLHWTAPPAGTGPVSFLYAVVVRYDQGVVNMFYATLQTMPIAEIPTTGTTPTAGAASLSGVGFWAILATAIITAAKMVV